MIVNKTFTIPLYKVYIYTNVLTSTLKRFFYSLFFQPRKIGPLEMEPCNNVEQTHSQEFIDELTVLANIVSLKYIARH